MKTTKMFILAIIIFVSSIATGCYNYTKYNVGGYNNPQTRKALCKKRSEFRNKDAWFDGNWIPKGTNEN